MYKLLKFHFTNSKNHNSKFWQTEIKNQTYCNHSISQLAMPSCVLDTKFKDKNASKFNAISNNFNFFFLVKKKIASKDSFFNTFVCCSIFDKEKYSTYNRNLIEKVINNCRLNKKASMELLNICLMNFDTFSIWYYVSKQRG